VPNFHVQGLAANDCFHLLDRWHGGSSVAYAGDGSAEKNAVFGLQRRQERRVGKAANGWKLRQDAS
jgi:hypothetical protein